MHGQSACTDLDLIQRVHEVQTRDSILDTYQDVFTGLGLSHRD